MDPFTQGALGAAFSQSFGKKKNMTVACIAGIVGGMAPDLDIVIKSSTDPLLALEFHRHFTHSIWFIPFGSLIVATVLWLIFGKLLKREIWDFKTTYIFSALGYATHATLDACTSYGTRLFWPFSNARVAWDTISVIDPLVTIPLILFVIFSAKLGSPKVARIGMAVFFSYMSLGFLQNARVTDTIEQIAADRGHDIERLKLNPTLGNLIVWRSTYQYDGSIADLRYSGEPQKIEPIWGIFVDPSKLDAHVEYGNFRGPSSRALDTTWDMMWGDYTPEQENDLAP